MVTTAMGMPCLQLSVAARRRVMPGPGACSDAGPVVETGPPASVYGPCGTGVVVRAREVSPLARAATVSLHGRSRCFVHSRGTVHRLTGAGAAAAKAD